MDAVKLIKVAEHAEQLRVFPNNSSRTKSFLPSYLATKKVFQTYDTININISYIKIK